MKINMVRVEQVPVKMLEAALSDPLSPPGRILTAAEDVFAQKGYKAATTREIAKRAGVNIATIHYYWGPKDELWYVVIHHVLARIAELTAGLLDLPAADLESGIRAIVGKLVDIFADNPNYARLLQHRTLEGVSGESGKELSQPILDIGLGFVKKNRIKGFATAFDPAMVLFCLQGTLRIFFQETDSVRAIFGEDPSSFSPAFRQKLKDLISSFALYAAGIGQGQG
jgi:AcrR family transcriptional regulator